MRLVPRWLCRWNRRPPHLHMKSKSLTWFDGKSHRIWLASSTFLVFSVFFGVYPVSDYWQRTLFICQLSAVNSLGRHNQLKRGKIPSEKWGKMGKIVLKSRKNPLFLCCPSMTINDGRMFHHIVYLYGNDLINQMCRRICSGFYCDSVQKFD